MITFYTKEEYKELQAKFREAQETIAVLEQLRPVWAAQESSAVVSGALSQLWAMLGVNNQTAAVSRLRDLVAFEWQASGLGEG